MVREELVEYGAKYILKPVYLIQNGKVKEVDCLESEVYELFLRTL